MLQTDQLQIAINDFVNNYSKECNKSSKTVQNIKDALHLFNLWLGTRFFTLSNVCQYVVYLSDQGLAPSTIHARVQILRAFVNFLHKRGYITESFAAKIPKPKVPNKPFTFISPEKLEQAILAGTEPGAGDNTRNKRIKRDTRLVLLFMLRTGLRIGEALKLTGKDLNLQDNPPSYWVDGKGSKKALMPLPIDFIPLLAPDKQNGRLFSTTEKTCNLALKRGCNKVGIEAHLTCHSLRHIFATSRLRAGIPVQVVKRLLRHSNVQITDEIYSHYVIDDLSVAINSQPLIQNGLDTPQTFDLTLASIKQTGVFEDKRFEVKILKTNSALTIEIMLKGI